MAAIVLLFSAKAACDPTLIMPSCAGTEAAAGQKHNFQGRFRETKMTGQ